MKNGRPITEVDRRFAVRLREVREHHGLTMDQVAAGIGAGGRNVIAAMEVGKPGDGGLTVKLRPVTLGEFIALCRFLHVTPGQMLSPEPLDMAALPERELP